MKIRKFIDQAFFKGWNRDMSYLLGYMAADGCIIKNKARKNNPFTINITSVDRTHLVRLKKALKSEHKINKKFNGLGSFAYQLQIRNKILAEDLIRLGIVPRKTYYLKPIDVPRKYFADFVRGFFDGDGSVYIYVVNQTPQIKASFVCASRPFIANLNQRLCKYLRIPEKSIHEVIRNRKLPQYSSIFYVDDCEKLRSFLYKDNPHLYLLRKRKIFEKWKLTKRRPYKKYHYPSKVGWRIHHRIKFPA